MLTDDDMNKLAQGFCIQGLSGKSHFDWLGFARAIEALVRAECAPQWQPIETAPKDGTTVLLHGMWAGEVSGIDPDPRAEAGYYSNGGYYRSEGFVWSATGGDCYGVWCKPNGWMPLPAAPSITAPQGEQQ